MRQDPNDNALERAVPLLLPEHVRNADALQGYLDLLPNDLPSTTPVQNLMQNGFVSQIYERWWRPALGRMAKGLFGPGMTDEHRIARLLLGLTPGDGVLDVACGPGNFSRQFARTVGDMGLVVGIDASRPMIERAVREVSEQEIHNLAFVRGNAVALPFKEGAFDAVCCFAALHLFDDPFAALDQMRSVLTRGGRIALFTTCRTRSAPLRGVETALGQKSGMKMFEQREIVEALEQRGFHDIRQRVAGFTQFVGGRLHG